MERIIEILRDVKSAAIIPHISADGDAVGSCKAMEEMLSSMGIKTVIYLEEPLEQRLKFLDGGMVLYNGSAVEHDVCIVLDCGDEGRIGNRMPIVRAAEKVINIDHHRTNTYFGDENYVDTEASATGELLARLFRAMGEKLTDKAAEYLYAAICSDTGCFAYSNTSPETMRIAAELMEYNFDHAEIARLLFDCVSINTALMRAELTSCIHSYYGGKLRIVAADEEFAAKYGVEPNDIQGLVDIPRGIDGTEVAVSIKQADGKIKASLRSNGNTDVATIAQTLGGGGHTRAAGCTLDAADLDEAENIIVKAFERSLS